jgi:hypothetical protein
LIASAFSQHGQATIHQPDERMEEIRRMQDLLDQQPEVVELRNMDDFMGQGSLQGSVVMLPEQIGRQKNCGPHNADVNGERRISAVSR